MVELYRGFEKWLDIYGRDIIVPKNSTKSLCSVVASWTAKDDEENNISGETEEVDPIDGSDEDEEEGYCSDTGNKNLSIMLSREDKQRK